MFRKPGRMNYSAAGLTKFRKVRLDLARMAIVRDDFTFAESDPFGRRIAYGSAGDCYSMHYSGACRKGHFKVNLTHTGLRLKLSIHWQAIGFPPSVAMHDYKRSKDGTLVSAKCGGWCGKCRPIGEMLVEQTVCRKHTGYIAFSFPLLTKVWVNSRTAAQTLARALRSHSISFI